MHKAKVYYQNPVTDQVAVRYIEYQNIVYGENYLQFTTISDRVEYIKFSVPHNLVICFEEQDA